MLFLLMSFVEDFLWWMKDVGWGFGSVISELCFFGDCFEGELEVRN